MPQNSGGGGQRPQQPRPVKRQPPRQQPRKRQPDNRPRPRPRPRPIHYVLPPIRNSPPLLSGLIGAAGFAMIGILLVAFGGIHIGGSSHSGNKSSKSHGKLPSVSIAGSIPCQLSPKSHNDACVSAKTYAKAQLTAMGDANQWHCLDQLWTGESDWNAWSEGSMTQYGRAQGIPQSLDHGHVFDLGDWQKQVDWGIDYIYHRSHNFHDPCSAWTFWNSHTPHWY